MARSIPASGARAAPAPPARLAGARRTPVACRASPLDRLRDALAGRKVLAVEGGEEDLGEMARLDQDTPAGTEDVFGPTAVLLVGFMAEEVSRFKAVMGEMGADMVAVIPAGRSLMASTLQQALEGGPAPYEQPPLGQRRAVIMSGMFTSEVLEVISGYKDAGLPPTVFAAAVPNNYARAVGEVVESCWKDQMLAQQRAAMGKMGASIEEA